MRIIAFYHALHHSGFGAL